MSIESNRPPQEAEHENTAEMIAPTNPPGQAPASVTPTGEAGGRRKMGKSGPPGPAAKGRTVAKRKPEKKRPVPAKKAARAKNTRATTKTFREKAGWDTAPKVGGRKPSADQKKGPIKKAGPAQKTPAKRAATKTATAAKRAPAAAKRAPAAAKRTAKRATGRR